MSEFKDSTALVTGGARGMGRLLARRALERGSRRVVLWDVDETALVEAAGELGGAGGHVETRAIDLTDAGQIEAGAREVLETCGAVDVLFNNAGVVVGMPFEAHSADDIERSIRVNVLAAMHTARAFLPAMIERRRGHVVNTASAAGLTPNPNMSVYAASKWAMLGWSESLRLELESAHEGVRVTTVCPSYVDTGMFQGARAPLLTRVLEPEAVVDKIIRAVETNRILVRTPAIVNLLPVLRGVLPSRWFDVLIGRGFGIYSSMDRFTGRTAGP